MFDIENVAKFRTVTLELSELVVPDGDTTEACARCPYFGKCLDEELWWHCAAYERTTMND